jgi:hypothetical protein
MTFAAAKELERLRAREASAGRKEEFDTKQREIDRTVSRRSGAWHKARIDLAVERIVAGVDDCISIRRNLVEQCPALATLNETAQFEQRVASLVEGQFQALLRSLPVMGVRPLVSVLAEFPNVRLALRQKAHMAGRVMQLEAANAEKPSLPPAAVVCNVSGSNARVNINSHDQSSNATAVIEEVSAQKLRLLAHPNTVVEVWVDRQNRSVSVTISNRGAHPFRIDNAEVNVTDDEGEPFTRKLHDLCGVIVGSGDSARASVLS